MERGQQEGDVMEQSSKLNNKANNTHDPYFGYYTILTLGCSLARQLEKSGNNYPLFRLSSSCGFYGLAKFAFELVMSCPYYLGR